MALHGDSASHSGLTCQLACAGDSPPEHKKARMETLPVTLDSLASLPAQAHSSSAGSAVVHQSVERPNVLRVADIAQDEMRHQLSERLRSARRPASLARLRHNDSDDSASSGVTACLNPPEFYPKRGLESPAVKRDWLRVCMRRQGCLQLVSIESKFGIWELTDGSVDRWYVKIPLTSMEVRFSPPSDSEENSEEPPKKVATMLPPAVPQAAPCTGADVDVANGDEPLPPMNPSVIPPPPSQGLGAPQAAPDCTGAQQGVEAGGAAGPEAQGEGAAELEWRAESESEEGEDSEEPPKLATKSNVRGPNMLPSVVR